MKTLTVRVPDALAAEIVTESRQRRISKSEVVRERLESGVRMSKVRRAPLEGIADLIGSVDDDLPADLSARTKHYLEATGFGRKHAR